MLHRFLVHELGMLIELAVGTLWILGSTSLGLTM